jgi:hypothetical protein
MVPSNPRDFIVDRSFLAAWLTPAILERWLLAADFELLIDARRACAFRKSDGGGPQPATLFRRAKSWHYAIAHWVEDDPTVGDGAFSSPGAFGFYPWIDAGKTTYGVLARHANVSLSGNDPVAVESVVCGRAIRKAWFTSVAQ